MKFYKINRGANTTKFCEIHFFNESLWKNEELYFNKYEEKHEIPIKYELNNQYDPKSFPSSDAFLVSEKFFSVIKKLNKDFEYFESELYYKKNEKMWGNYYTVIFPEYELFNWNKSDYSLFPSNNISSKDISFLRKIVLDNEKIMNRETANQFFVLSESSCNLLCTETAKQAIEDAGLFDIIFEEIPVE